MIALVFSVLFAFAAGEKGPCIFDGHTYNEGDIIMIEKCLATMTCLGDNNYGNMVQLGGVCPHKRATNGQTGCLFDGQVYSKGDRIIIQPCLAEMTCNGNNNYINMVSLGGQCPTIRRQANGQDGCLFDGHVYATGEKIMIPNCLGEMTCLGNNNYSPITSYGGICPNKREVNGQTGCVYDGRIYSTGDVITVSKCLAQFTCLGNNVLSQITQLGGQC